MVGQLRSIPRKPLDNFDKSSPRESSFDLEEELSYIQLLMIFSEKKSARKQ